MGQRAAAVRLEVEANGAGIRLNIVVAVDVELQKHQPVSYTHLTLPTNREV